MSKFNFKSTGTSIEEDAKIKKYEISSSRLKNEKKPIGILLPLQKGNKKNESLFKMSFDLSEQILNNFRNFLMTKKGEMIGNPSFGTSLGNIINFTNLEKSDIEEFILEEINLGIRNYFTNTLNNTPFINIQNLSISREKNNEDLDEFIIVNIDFYILNSNELKNMIINFKLNK